MNKQQDYKEWEGCGSQIVTACHIMIAFWVQVRLGTFVACHNPLFSHVFCLTSLLESVKCPKKEVIVDQIITMVEWGFLIYFVPICLEKKTQQLKITSFTAVC